jgi:hypothetical protein
MFVHRIFKNLKVTWCLLVIVALLTLPACPPSVLQVDKVSLRAPDWLDPNIYKDKLLVTVYFNSAVHQDTIVIGKTVKIDLVGHRINIPGRRYFSTNSWELVYVSRLKMNQILTRGGGPLYYTITLIGDDVGDGAVTGLNGNALDGDKDGNPGGNFVENRTVPR